jgi:CheY-like chemotaxis protein
MSRIMVVDDDLVNLMIACSALESGGHKAIGTTDPDEAIDLVRRGEVDAAILDILMPRMSGFDLLRRIRETPGAEELPVLFLSGMTDADARARGLSAGANDYVDKPFHHRELLARLERQLRRHAAPDDHDHLAGDFKGLPLGDLLQLLAESRRSGLLRILSRGHEGEIHVAKGVIRAVRYRNRSGRWALLELLQATEGSFRLLDEEPPNSLAADAGAPIHLRACLLEIAWVSDEMRRREGFLPEADTRYVVTRDRPFGNHDLAALPLQQIYDAIRRMDRPTLSDLLALDLAPDDYVRLGFAVLVEEDLIQYDRRATDSKP